MPASKSTEGSKKLLKTIKEKKSKKIAEVTIEQLKRAAPLKTRKHITQDYVDQVNAFQDPNIETEMYRENILGYIGVMAEGQFKMPDYINAVKYCSSKLLGSTDIEAYVRTFPDRFQRLVDMGTTDVTIAAHVSMYGKRAIVNKIMEQTMMPTHIINADLYQKSINRLAYLMMNASSEKVQGDSAGKLVDVLRPPETTKVELEIGLKDNDALVELRNATIELAAQQRIAIDAGVPVKTIAHSKIVSDIIDAEVTDESE